MEDTQHAPLRSDLPHGYRMHPRLGVVYDRAPADSDDLTVVDGINTREAVGLNQAGVYTCAQIAMWSEDQVTAVAEHLGVSEDSIVRQNWVEQARRSSGRRAGGHADPPASMIRTVSLVACALLCGFLAVFFLSRQSQQPWHGVLSAEITTLRVPATCRLQMTHVQPGDEVFSGEVLLTLEKLDHLRTIEAQQVRVRELQNELQKAEAQARLNIDLKQSEIECQLFELQAQLESARADSPAEADAAPAVVLSETAGKELPLVTVSSSNEVTQHRPRPGGLIFFSGESGQATPFTAMQEAATAAGEAPNFSLPPAAKPVSGPSAPKPSADEVRIVDLESRLRKLEDLQELMPDRILQAAGIEQMRMHLEDARKTLEAMQSASREISVVSPSYGVVGQIRHRAGDLLESGDVLLKILHSERRFVVVYVPTDAIGQLQSGSRVKLRYPGHEEYEGLVTAIPSIVDAASPGTSTLAAVRVEESGRMWPELPIGSRVDVVMN